ncbi:hypothetical protein QFC19_001095 [Naganishia cerealis]|uniref:Uncharacterized protein n=1 Tax=Naganishia cerealis TaxID=610337 RepID=A0ACC2WKQ6_9TREE|nr:hypothetical protein QFC19_001095 [Naganishia cerealis]
MEILRDTRPTLEIRNPSKPCARNGVHAASKIDFCSLCKQHAIFPHASGTIINLATVLGCSLQYIYPRVDPSTYPIHSEPRSRPSQQDIDSSSMHTDNFATNAVHAGSAPDPSTGAVIPSISLSTTYRQDSIGVHKGFEYSRSANPNRNDFETMLASLEVGSEEAIAFSSGSAATAAAAQWACLSEEEGGGRTAEDIADGGKSHILCINDMYGGTYRYLARVAKTTGNLEASFLDFDQVGEAGIRSAIRRNTKRKQIVWIESPTNPMLILPPLTLISEILHSIPEAHRPILLVDNTFLSPYYSNPLTLGADVALHSISKYINGHSDVIMGALVIRKGSAQRLSQGFRFLQNSSGGIPSPFDCYLASRGAKTLPLRALKHGLNALQISTALSKDSRIAKVSYPGLKSSPYYERAVGALSRQAKKDLSKLGWDTRALEARAGIINGTIKHHRPHHFSGNATTVDAITEQGIPFSGMISIHLASPDPSDPEVSHAITDKFLTSLRLFSLAESLGGVESLAEAPWQMTHGSIPEAQRLALGIDPSLVRLSVGIEDVDDLLQDIHQALDVAFS